MNNNYLIIMVGGVGSRYWSMSTSDMLKQGIAWDNAVAESFFKILKVEMIYEINLFQNNK